MRHHIYICMVALSCACIMLQCVGVCVCVVCVRVCVCVFLGRASHHIRDKTNVDGTNGLGINSPKCNFHDPPPKNAFNTHSQRLDHYEVNECSIGPSSPCPALPCPRKYRMANILPRVVATVAIVVLCNLWLPSFVPPAHNNYQKN